MIYKRKDHSTLSLTLSKTSLVKSRFQFIQPVCQKSSDVAQLDVRPLHFKVTLSSIKLEQYTMLEVMSPGRLLLAPGDVPRVDWAISDAGPFSGTLSPLLIRPALCRSSSYILAKREQSPDTLTAVSIREVKAGDIELVKAFQVSTTPGSTVSK